MKCKTKMNIRAKRGLLLYSQRERESRKESPDDGLLERRTSARIEELKVGSASHRAAL